VGGEEYLVEKRNGLTGARSAERTIPHRLHLRLVLLDALQCRGLFGALEHGKGRRAIAVPQVLEAIQCRRAAGLGQTQNT